MKKEVSIITENEERITLETGSKKEFVIIRVGDSYVMLNHDESVAFKEELEVIMDELN